MSVLQRLARYWDSFPSLPSNAAASRRAAAAFASEWLSGEDLTDFELAIGEVLANIVRHSKSYGIAVHCYPDSGRLVAEIRSYGPGFVPPKVIEPPPKGALRGYGLFLMHYLLDELEFLDCGRRVRLVKRFT